jgi:hypothetical protein
VTRAQAIDLDYMVRRALDGIDTKYATLCDSGRELLRVAKASADHRLDAERVARAWGLKLEEI